LSQTITRWNYGWKERNGERMEGGKGREAREEKGAEGECGTKREERILEREYCDRTGGNRSGMENVRGSSKGGVKGK